MRSEGAELRIGDPRAARGPRYICLARADQLDAAADLYERHAERLLLRGQVKYARRERVIAAHARRVANSARQHAGS